MSAKAKLTLALLAATALFTFNPNFAATLLHVDDTLSAEELPIDPSAINGLNALTNTSTRLDNKSSNNGDIIAPQRDFSDLAPATAETPVATRDVIPGANPFATNVGTQPALSATPVETQTLGALDSAKSVSKTTIQPTTNPFADPAAVKAEQAQPDTADKVTVKVDDGALRYYAASKDLKRLGAEMRRLKTIYPDWQPPKDLFSPVANVNEQPLWDIYKTGNYAALRAKIAQMQSVNPKWQPSEDLVAKLQSGETRSLINRSFAQHQWMSVISTAQADPTIMVCSDMQVLWNVGESFAQIHKYAESFDLYKYILTNCDNPQMRLATIQKASLLLPAQGTTSLLGLGRVMPDGSAEFENIGFDGTRRQIGTFIQEGDLSTAPTDEDLKRFVDFIQRTGSAADAGLMGWFFYAQQDWPMSNSWFVHAAQMERTSKNLEGVILTLRNMERPADALKVARRYLKASPDIATQYIEIVSEQMTSEKPEIAFKDKESADFEKLVADQKSPLGAQAIGWKYLNGGDSVSAKTWFAQSVSWKPTEGGVVGLAVLASRAKDYKVLSSLKTDYLKQYASLDDFKTYTAKKVYRTKKTKRVTVNDAQNIAPKKKRSGFQFQSPG
jgi:hypothetical protein